MDVRQRGAIGGGLGPASGGGVDGVLFGAGAAAKPLRRTYPDINKSKVASSGKSWMLICMIFVILIIVVSVLVVGGKENGAPTSLIRSVKEVAAPSADLVERTQFEKVQEENRELHKRITTLQKQKTTAEEAAAVAKSAVGNGAEGQLTKQVTRLTTYKHRMHEMIQLISKRNLLHKYGPGPHYVEILIRYDPASNIADTTKGSDDTDTLLIELAPVDEMPATVFWFLEQVNATLFDGCSFHRNAHHVVQGGPAPNFETTSIRTVRQKFSETELDSVPFQEYSPNFPHVKYTLGYAGRPGGPDFYVSTADNTRNHGPGGQGSYEDVGEADPCFAKVVPGFEPVVDRMHKSTVKPGNYNAMEHNIAIRHMRLISSENAANLMKARSS